MPRPREEWKTYDDIFSRSTINSLIKLAQRHVFSHIIGKISMGKEAVVLSATSELYGLVAIKVYMINTCNFRRMYEYLSQDNRYLKLPRNRQKIIYNWAEREYKNLEIAYRSNARVPMPIAVLNNIIVMEFIGDRNKGMPAQLLKNIRLEGRARQVYEEIIENYKKIYNQGLVHGDLSEFNILLHEGKPIMIDFSQGTVEKSLNYLDLLKRDLEKISNYFSKYIDIDLEETARRIGVWDIVKNL